LVNKSKDFYDQGILSAKDLKCVCSISHSPTSFHIFTVSIVADEALHKTESPSVLLDTISVCWIDI